ncbi:hypothetical protein P879_02804 [Paragonimus westermani]|uniref:Uncharacterized protein n=1 Tax=Paragonimus westermani TaxID=34504 RepID=A0A8T0DY19_9TREM|nr:hypothetical protein P879_02804 [Paragonimus westermani]
MHRLRNIISEPQTPGAPSWSLLSCFAVNLSTELKETGENGNSTETSSHTFERYQEQPYVPEKSFVVLLCIPNHRLSEIRSIESFGSSVSVLHMFLFRFSRNQTEEETKLQLTNELKSFSSILYKAYSLRLEARISSAGQVR